MVEPNSPKNKRIKGGLTTINEGWKGCLKKRRTLDDFVEGRVG